MGGIRSTGLSGCLGIAERVHELVERDLQIEPSRGVFSHVSRPVVKFTGRGTAEVDDVTHKITHPITVCGTKQYQHSKL